MTATNKLRAFHNDPAIKAKYLARVQAHHDADEIIHGQYWENGKGCAVGCTIHSSNHSAYEDELGLPSWLARLEDGMFEAQNNSDSKTFPVRFLQAIPVGADTEQVKLPFLAWLMDDPKWGLANREDVDAEVRGLAAEVGAMLRKGELTGDKADDLTNRLWAARAAWDAWDARAAWAARDAWDARAAWAARDARGAWAAWAARDARGAWAARDAWAAWDAFAKASADELLRLLAALTPEQIKNWRNAMGTP